MEQTANTFVQIILTEAIRVLAPIVLALVGAWLVQLTRKAQASLGEQRWWQITQAVQFAVEAAQQSGLSQQISNEGKAKKAWALGVARKFLLERGITVDVATLENLIEQAVFNLEPPVATPPPATANTGPTA
jgi:hypothetical protein